MQNDHDLKKSEGFGGKSHPLWKGWGVLMVLELLGVTQLLSNPNGWARVQHINNSSLINAKRCRAGRGISAPQAPSRVLNCVKPRKGPPSNRDSTAETSALCRAAATKLTRCSAAYGKGRRVILEIL